MSLQKGSLSGNVFEFFGNYVVHNHINQPLNHRHYNEQPGADLVDLEQLEAWGQLKTTHRFITRRGQCRRAKKYYCL